jgi:hypothetical protein
VLQITPDELQLYIAIAVGVALFLKELPRALTTLNTIWNWYKKNIGFKEEWHKLKHLSSRSHTHDEE